MKSSWVWIIGGLLIGTGFLFLIGAFGDTGFGLIMGDSQQHAATSYSKYGYDASLILCVRENHLRFVWGRGREVPLIGLQSYDRGKSSSKFQEPAMPR